MSRSHPIISITGSSGAGTSTVRKTFEQIMRREKINAACIEGDAFHRYDRMAMREMMKKETDKGNLRFSHFGSDANLFKKLEETFRTYGETGGGETRHYIHDDAEAERYGSEPGTFTDWEQFPENTDLLFYEGLHGAVVTDDVDIARYADVKIGVVPVMNLEWIQKIHRDKDARGYTTQAVTDTILRRMPDYIDFIVSQFHHTDINFQRTPTVDVSNPFIARWIPTPNESIVVIRWASPTGIDFPYMLAMIPQSYMSRANSIVIRGGYFDLALQLILTPLIKNLVEGRRTTE